MFFFLISNTWQLSLQKVTASNFHTELPMDKPALKGNCCRQILWLPPRKNPWFPFFLPKKHPLCLHFLGSSWKEYHKKLLLRQQSFVTIVHHLCTKIKTNLRRIWGITNKNHLKLTLCKLFLTGDIKPIIKLINITIQCSWKHICRKRTNTIIRIIHARFLCS